MKILKFISKTVNNIILCLRFPFLYPRNRFTGRHYNNWKVLNYADKILRESEFTIFFNVVNNYDDTFSRSQNFQVKSNNFIAEIKDGNLVIRKEKSVKPLFINEFSDEYNNDISLKLRWRRDDEITVLVYVPENIDVPQKFGIHKHVVNRILHIWAKVVRFFHNYVLGALNSIPTYTELDAMETGWRKAFGISMCSDIKKAILRTYTSKIGGKWYRHPFKYIIAIIRGIGFLYSYRIIQIKEKYGSLRWYDANTTKEICDIIGKYENLSYKTCIECGKQAKYLSGGWICPYCEEHFDSGKQYVYATLNKDGNWEYDEDLP